MRKKTDEAAHIFVNSICSVCKCKLTDCGDYTELSFLSEKGHAEKTVTYVSDEITREQLYEYEYYADDSIKQKTTYEDGEILAQIAYDQNGQSAVELQRLSPEGEKDPHQLLINNVQGYSLLVGNSFYADASLSGIVTVLENEDCVIELYKQRLSKDFNSATYLRFSHAFLKNSSDHLIDYRGTKTYGSRSVRVTVWHREKLARVENDKNHYISYDVYAGNYMFSIFVKSSVPIEDPGKYSFMAESLKLFEPSAQAPLWKSGAVQIENRGWNEETLAFYQKYYSEDSPLTWGFFDPQSAYGKLDEIKAYEEALDYKFPIILTYFDFSPSNYTLLKQTLEGSWDNGKVLELTLQTYALPDGSNMMYDILQGKYDDAIQYYARTIRNFGHPVLLRLMNEMNGDWCQYSAYHTSKDTLIYKEVYKYIYGIFKESGADNVIWVWNPNEGSFPNYDWNNELMYYPGDEYVDIVGMTAYNTGTYYWEYGERWKSFSALYEKLYAEYCGRYSQPLMITEFSCAKKGGDKVAWVENMFDKIDTYDRIKVAVWWNHVDYRPGTSNISRNYLVDDPAEVLNVFKNNI